MVLHFTLFFLRSPSAQSLLDIFFKRTTIKKTQPKMTLKVYQINENKVKISKAKTFVGCLPQSAFAYCRWLDKAMLDTRFDLSFILDIGLSSIALLPPFFR